MIHAIETTGDLRTIEKVWFELHREQDACDAIVQLDDGLLYTTLFVTLDYVQRQMELNSQVLRQIEDAPQVRYAAFDTPHVLVESLDHDTIEDTIDNLLVLDVFESLFTRVTDHQAMPKGKHATQEVAAVVIEEVLVTQA